MKKTMLLLTLMVVALGSYAQTWNEWFRQNRTQKKYLIEQIAALKVYEEYVKTGYKIVNGGINLIGDLKNGDFNLHRRYFDDLVTVNPQIKQYAKIGETINAQAQLIRVSQQTMRTLNQSGMMKEEELLYVKRVFDRVIDNAILLLDELSALVSDRELSLKDDERLERIDQVNAETRELQAFIIGFSNEAKQLALMRKNDEVDIKRMRGYHGIIE